MAKTNPRPRRRRQARRKPTLPMRKLRKFRPARNVSEYASCSVSQWIQFNTVTNTMYNLRNIALNQFRRAVSIANGYQHYRIKKVTLEFKPAYDTFVAGNAVANGAALQVPYLIYMIDKSGSIPTLVGTDDLRQMGARPIRFDDKVIKVSWRPSVLQETFGNTAPLGSQSQYKISPWLSTNANALNPGSFVPSGIDHLGIFFKVDRPGGTLPEGIAEYSYDVQITCEFEFKKPLVQATNTVPATTINMHEYTTGNVDLSGNNTA